MATSQPLATSAPNSQRAWQLLQLHRPELALQMSEHLLAHDPASAPALAVRTEALRQLERLPEAATAAKAAVAQSPQSAEAFYRLAQVLGQQGKLRESELTVRDAIRLDPVDATYYGLLAQLQHLLRRNSEAIATANRGLALDARHSDCLLWRALAQEANDQPTAADEDFSHLLRVVPNSALVHTRLGQLLLKRFEPQAAAPHLAEALRQAPDEAPRLVPLLQQARRQATWPAWLLRKVRREVGERALGIEAGFRAVPVRLAMTAYTFRADWLTRHDPLFQLHMKPARAHPWASRPLAWVALVVLLAMLIYFNATLGLRAGPGIFMQTIFALRYMLKRRDKDKSTPNF